MNYLDNLTYATRYLALERYGQKQGDAFVKQAHHNEEDLFTLYRNLVNTRQPLPASKDFFDAQDAMLQEAARRKGIIESTELPPAPRHPALHLWRGDITALRVDAIVNAANSQMLGCWVPGHYCIDNAIHTFAGIQLRLECARLMEAQGYPEPTGMAKVTPAYNLPSSYVIHTVGPIANGHPSDLDRQLLANSYTSCLDAALDNACQSIAFCCISTGVFGFPQKEAARIALTTVETWLARHPANPLQILFNVFSERDEEMYHELLFN